MFQILSFTKEDIVALRVSGKVSAEDYKKVQPLLQKTVKDFGEIDLYIEMDHVEGIKPAAMWEDFKTYFSYVNRIRAVAVVGEDNWSKTLSGLIKPFIKGPVKYFTADDSLKAKKWIDQQRSG
ncbi:MAG: STAS/SEC14 domain-containing protein [Bacteroidales bacterium]|nr:STAS/SEC14 domain-containing protein [Bacteroidales bacterium]